MEGLAKVTIPGRMEMVSTTPRVIVDGAHNGASVDALMKAIGQHIRLRFHRGDFRLLWRQGYPGHAASGSPAVQTK